MRTNPQTPQGVAKRHSDWDDITEVSSIGRSTLQAVPNYRLFKAATRATAASPQARLLLVHLIGYLGADRVDDPSIRLVAFPGTNRLRSEEHTDELQSLLRIPYSVFCLTKKNINTQQPISIQPTLH